MPLNKIVAHKACLAQLLAMASSSADSTTPPTQLHASIHQLTVDGTTWHKANDLGTLLGAKNIRRTVKKNVTDSKHWRRLADIIPLSGVELRRQDTIYVTEQGLKRIIAGSNLPASGALAT